MYNILKIKFFENEKIKKMSSFHQFNSFSYQVPGNLLDKNFFNSP